MIKNEKFIKNIKPIEKDKYTHIDLDRLIIYTVNLLEEEKIDTTFDNVVVAVFKLFQNRFSLVGFPEYPDAKRTHDCLFHCTYKTKQWLFGNAKSGYYITDKGRYILDETNRRLSGDIKNTKYIESAVKRKETHFLDLIKNDVSYRKYTFGEAKEITEQDIRGLLRVTANTPNDIVKENFNRYKDYSMRLKDKDVTKFLNIIEKQWKDILG